MRDGVFALLLFFFVFYIFLGPKEEHPTKTFYSASCDDKKHSIHDCPTVVTPISLTFKFIVETQKVIEKGAYWVDKSGKRKCIVFDENNWRCEEGDYWMAAHDGFFDDATTEYVTEGEYARTTEDGQPLFKLYSSISYTRYLYYKLIYFLKSLV